MKTIIAGSRTIQDYDVVKTCINYWRMQREITEVVCGMANGVDLLGKDWADEEDIPVAEFWPEYKKYGRYKAPKKRNRDMGDYADAALAIWDGYSTGTIHMVEYMKKLRKRWMLFDLKNKTIRVDERHFRDSIQFL